LLHTRTIMGRPEIGRVDGTSAIAGDSGYVFLFNPNARRLSAEFRLDDSIGLGTGDLYVLAEVFPQKGRLLGNTARGAWAHGERVSVAMDGTSAMVLEIRPAPRGLTAPLLFNAAGTAVLAHRSLALAVSGEPGTLQ